MDSAPAAGYPFGAQAGETPAHCCTFLALGLSLPAARRAVETKRACARASKCRLQPGVKRRCLPHQAALSRSPTDSSSVCHILESQAEDTLYNPGERLAKC